ncbi:predicted protein [Plenodomus lingam JN3]|uniref:Predicted protein n=2 Tax=Leptosphaeria maculans TaxID=5022 RepID=E5AAX7_LEPMJ|nr:predicted protein [Plenodomus lingam JN3]CBY00818.1 predicted protein [Plenodomus lingam JN3]
MTTLLHLATPAFASRSELKHASVTLEAPTRDSEIPKVKGIQESKNAADDIHANAVHMNGVYESDVIKGRQNADSDPFKLASEYAYTPRKLKVFTIGAGFSGLLMAHKFQHRFLEMREYIDHTIFEAHHEVGGTW